MDPRKIAVQAADFKYTSGQVIVGPLQRYSNEVLLNEWLRFDQSGQYELQIEFAGAIYDSAGKSTRIERRVSVDILVSARDEQLLRNACDDLARRVEQSEHWDEAHNAAKALASINDPVAIDYLHRVVRADKLVDLVGISALERIGGDAAVHALRQEATNRHPDTASAARAALSRLGARR
jgi:hypothetical protein